MFTIYKAVNTVTGKCYYGATTRPLNLRLNEHRHRGTFGKDINHISIYPLVYCEDREQMFSLELHLISCNPDGYNIQGTSKDNKPGNKRAGNWNKKLKGHSVVCMEDNKSFPSLREAATYYSITGSTISRAIKDRTGFIKSINKTFIKETYNESRHDHF